MIDLLDVRLDNFEGPLDLLIHLIYKNELDIYDIPISFIAGQFVHAVREMEKLDIEVAAEFINMASYLIHLKSRMLLPKESSYFEDEYDPEEEKFMLQQRLADYSFFKDVAKFLQDKGAESSRFLLRSESMLIPRDTAVTEEPFRLASKFFELITQEKDNRLVMQKEDVSLINIIEKIKTLVLEKYSIYWSDVLKNCVSKKEVAVSLLAVLELTKQKVITAIQNEPFGEIFIEQYDG